MKLRTTKNSIRIRIRKSELKTLQNENKISEAINFGGGVALTYFLKVDSSVERLTADFNNNKLVVSIPKNQADEWFQTELVGLEIENPLDNDEQLHILIEKDFPCLDRPEEDKSDTFQELAAKNEDHC